MYLETLAWIAFVFVLAAAWRWCAPMWYLLRLRFRRPTVETVEPAALPGEVAAVLGLARPRLEALGFAPGSCLKYSSILEAEPPQESYAATYVNAAHGVWASVALAETPERGWLYSVSFETFYEGARSVLSTDRRLHHFLFPPPLADHTDDYCGAVETQWARHLARMAAERAGLSPLTDAAAVRTRNRAMLSALLPAAVDSGVMTAARETGLHRLTLRGAKDYLRRNFAAHRRLAKLPLAAPDWNDVPAGDARAGELRAIADTRAVTVALAAQRAARDVPGMSALVFLGTLLLALAAFAGLMGWQTALMLMLVLIIHETGHLLVMRRLGYRGVRMFFVPLFGALVSGEQTAAKPWQLLLLYFAGPLPGLLGGLAIVYATLTRHLAVSPGLLTLGAIAIVLNVFNLLPVLPLDGGRIVETLWLARAPRVKLAFQALSIAALVVLGVWWDAKPLFFIALLFAMLLPRRAREARLLARLEAGQPAGFADREQAIAALCLAMAGPEFERARYPQRLAFVRTHVHEPLAPVPAPATRVIGSLVYAAALAAPMLLFTAFGLGGASWLFPSVPRISERAVAHDWEREIAAATEPGARWQLLYDAGEEAWNGEDEGRAYAYYRRAAELSATFPHGDHRRIEALLKLAATADDARISRDSFDEVLALAPPGATGTALARADALEGLSALDAAAPPAVRLERRREALALRESRQPADHWQVMAARSLYAALLDASGDAAGAERELRRNLEVLQAPPGPADPNRPDPPGARAGRTLHERIAVVWFLIGHGRAGEGLVLLGPEPPGMKGMDRTQFVLARAWALAGTGDTAGGLAAVDTLLGEARGTGIVRLYGELPLLVDRAILRARRGDAAGAAEAERRIAAMLGEVPPRQARFAWDRLSAEDRGVYTFEAPRLAAHRAWAAAHAGLAPVVPSSP